MGLDTVELIYEMEKHFQIEYSDEDLIITVTIGQLINLTSRLKSIESKDQSEFDEVFNKFQQYFNANINIDDKISDYLKINDFNNLSHYINLKIPQFSNFLKYVFLDHHFIDWKELTVENFINGILIKNCTNLIDVNQPKTTYQVYLIIGWITEDKIGSSFYDIQPHARFTKDLRID